MTLENTMLDVRLSFDKVANGTKHIPKIRDANIITNLKTTYLTWLHRMADRLISGLSMLASLELLVIAGVCGWFVTVIAKLEHLCPHSIRMWAVGVSAAVCCTCFYVPRGNLLTRCAGQS